MSCDSAAISRGAPKGAIMVKAIVGRVSALTAGACPYRVARAFKTGLLLLSLFSLVADPGVARADTNDWTSYGPDGGLSRTPLIDLPTPATMYGGTASPREAYSRERTQLAAVAIPFVANAGQTDAAVAYYAQTFSGTVFVTRKGQLVYALPAPAQRALATGWSLIESFVGGQPVPVVGPPGPTRVSSFLGADSARWRHNVPTYTEVALGEVYAGIEVRLKAYGQRVEKVFTIAPGAAPERASCPRR